MQITSNYPCEFQPPPPCFFPPPGVFKKNQIFNQAERNEKVLRDACVLQLHMELNPEDTTLTAVQTIICEAISFKGSSFLDFISKLHLQNTEPSYRATNKSDLHTSACKHRRGTCLKGITHSLPLTCAQKRIAIQRKEVMPSTQNHVVSCIFTWLYIFYLLWGAFLGGDGTMTLFIPN